MCFFLTIFRLGKIYREKSLTQQHTSNTKRIYTESSSSQELRQLLEKKYDQENRSIGINRTKIQTRWNGKIRSLSRGDGIHLKDKNISGKIVEESKYLNSQRTEEENRENEKVQVDSSKVVKKVVGNGRYVKLNHKYYEAVKFMDKDTAERQIKKGFKICNGMIFVLFDGDAISKEKLDFIQQSWKY